MVSIDQRYCGPPGSGNGGYSCGLVAAEVPSGDGIVEVTLRTPPPLDHAMRVEQRNDVTVLLDGDTLVAEARRVAGGLHSPAPVDLETALDAATGFPWLHSHPYPGCFVCGPDRDVHDGLRIFPGAVDGRRLAAAPWRPDSTLAGDDGRVRPEVLWAALDCPSWFGAACFETWEGRPLLGRLAAEIVTLPRIDEDYVCVGWMDERSGRKFLTGSAIFAANGDLVARARATWITVA